MIADVQNYGLLVPIVIDMSMSPRQNSIRKPGNKKIFTIDINKCSRNILLNKKHDYCTFNVMDEPKTFNAKSPNFEGLYKITKF